MEKINIKKDILEDKKSTNKENVEKPLETSQIIKDEETKEKDKVEKDEGTTTNQALPINNRKPVHAAWIEKSRAFFLLPQSKKNGQRRVTFARRI